VLVCFAGIPEARVTLRRAAGGWSKPMRRAVLFPARLLTAAGFVLATMTVVGMAQTGLDATTPAKASERMIADLARIDLNAFAADVAKYMSPGASNRIKNNFASIKDIGQSQYTDLIYSRDYGRMEKDIIYKINFDKAFAFVRFLWHVDNNNWHLVYVAYKTEGSLPFPNGWQHIYPK
jgi:hypothetical protein